MDDMMAKVNGSEEDMKLYLYSAVSVLYYCTTQHKDFAQFLCNLSTLTNLVACKTMFCTGKSETTLSRDCWLVLLCCDFLWVQSALSCGNNRQQMQLSLLITLC